MSLQKASKLSPIEKKNSDILNIQKKYRKSYLRWELNLCQKKMPTVSISENKKNFDDFYNFFSKSFPKIAHL